VCILANEAKCPIYIVHVMGREAAEAVENAKKKGF